MDFGIDYKSGRRRVRHYGTDQVQTSTKDKATMVNPFSEAQIEKAKAPREDVKVEVRVDCLKKNF